MLSLKAELLRKQNEVLRAKSKQAAEPFVPKTFPKSTNPSKQTKGYDDTRPKKKSFELEDNEQLERSRKILEAKSKFYDRMAKSGGSVNSDDNCLVQFNAKKQNETVTYGSSSEDSDDDDNGTQPIDPVIFEDKDGDWVEYTDSLGRTRKCLKSDLDFFQKRDKALIPDPDLSARPTNDDNIQEAYKSGTESESEDELLKTGRQIQQMRDNWEKQETENMDKEFVHYQDVLFNGKFSEPNTQPSI